MTLADLPAVLEIQAQAYDPFFHESEAAFRGKLGAFPAWCWVAEEAQGKLAAYLFAQPARLGRPPCLGDGGRSSGGDADGGADTLHLHDMAVSPLARGAGLARTLATHALAAARRAELGHGRLQWASLIAVQGSVPYWARHGFVAGPVSPDLSSYGPGAAYLIRSL
ncbi:N-acetyltransferase [Azospira sp. I13]|uniref:GNAT family N-acetyltransferase n=1 Tax=Azospira sp. I13 TaxID=1765050 RepID=UPI000D4EF2D2|nr:GNAT family N-acetyltransferase [Azospira sp. I13]GBG03530.1 N-acetyltransferase [Azospira sp. I13]